jgi:hypothetical protein
MDQTCPRQSGQTIGVGGAPGGRRMLVRDIMTTVDGTVANALIEALIPFWF